jgi:hypothetical protein
MDNLLPASISIFIYSRLGTKNKAFLQQQWKPLKLKIILSVFPLLIIGHLLARYVSDNKQTAWMYVTGFYALWLIFSLIFLIKVQDLKKMFSASQNWQWNLLFVPIIVLISVFIFIPNNKLLKWDYWLLLNVIICLVNPFMEEIYWRGLVGKISNLPLNSFLFSSLAFAASHFLIFGINSPGVAGLIGFAGTFLIGSLFWFCYFKTKV